MNRILMKFGGTSVQNEEAIRRVMDIVKGRIASGACPVVVVSAMSKVTRVLCEVADEAANQNVGPVAELIAALEERHRGVAEVLLKCRPDLLAQTLDKLTIRFKDLAEMCTRGAITDSVRAGIMSIGELLSSTIVAAAMNAEGIDCQWIDAREMVAVDNNFLNAHPYMDRTRELVLENVPDGKVVLTQGFIAKTLDGESAVLGFEGSDYSAAIFGMSLDAERVEIWTDVDGIRTADPRVVSDTQRIAKVSYDEAALMASCGARVLHPMTMDPARRKNIPVYVLNTMNPEGEGSVVCGETSDGPKSIAFSTEDRQADGTVKISVVGKNAIRVADIVREVAGSDISASDDVLSFNIPCDTASKVANELHRKLFPAEQK